MDFSGYLCLGLVGLGVFFLIGCFVAAHDSDFRYGRQFQQRLGNVPCSSCGMNSLRVIADPFAYDKDRELRLMYCDYVKPVECMGCQSYFLATDCDRDTDEDSKTITGRLDLESIDAAAVHRALLRKSGARRKLVAAIGGSLILLAAIYIPMWWYCGLGVCEIILPIVVVWFLWPRDV